MRKMERDAFWDLIAEANRTCGQDMDASYQHLMERLTALGPQYAQDFHDILHGYRDLAYQYGLWSAGAGPASDSHGNGRSFGMSTVPSRNVLTMEMNM